MCTDWHFHMLFLENNCLLGCDTNTQCRDVEIFRGTYYLYYQCSWWGWQIPLQYQYVLDTLSSIARFIWLLEWVITIAAFNRNYKLEKEKVTIMYWISFYFALQFTISWAKKIKKFLLKIWILAPFSHPLDSAPWGGHAHPHPHPHPAMPLDTCHLPEDSYPHTHYCETHKFWVILHIL